MGSCHSLFSTIIKIHIVTGVVIANLTEAPYSSSDAPLVYSQLDFHGIHTRRPTEILQRQAQT